MYKIVAPVMLSLALALTGCGSSPNADEVPDVSPESLYQVARANMASGYYGDAKRYLEAIDSRYPFGSMTAQVQLDLIHVYYKNRDTELAAAQVARFFRLNPTHPNIDYVYYMKGLIELQKRSDVIQEYLGLDRSEKDANYYLNAFNIFKELVTTYPNSPYAADARQRMIFIKNELAKRELAIAKYYYERGAYLSAARHSQMMLQAYRNTPVLEDALDLLATSYDRLKLTEAKDHALAVKSATFYEGYSPSYLPNPSSPVDAVSGVETTAFKESESTSSSWYDKYLGFFDFLFDEE